MPCEVTGLIRMSRGLKSNHWFGLSSTGSWSFCHTVSARFFDSVRSPMVRSIVSPTAVSRGCRTDWMAGVTSRSSSGSRQGSTNYCGIDGRFGPKPPRVGPAQFRARDDAQ